MPTLLHRAPALCHPQQHGVWSQRRPRPESHVQDGCPQQLHVCVGSEGPCVHRAGGDRVCAECETKEVFGNLSVSEGFYGFQVYHDGVLILIEPLSLNRAYEEAKLKTFVLAQTNPCMV